MSETTDTKKGLEALSENFEKALKGSKEAAKLQGQLDYVKEELAKEKARREQAEKDAKEAREAAQGKYAALENEHMLLKDKYAKESKANKNKITSLEGDKATIETMKNALEAKVTELTSKLETANKNTDAVDELKKQLADASKYAGAVDELKKQLANAQALIKTYEEWVKEKTEKYK